MGVVMDLWAIIGTQQKIGCERIKDVNPLPLHKA